MSFDNSHRVTHTYTRPHTYPYTQTLAQTYAQVQEKVSSVVRLLSFVKHHRIRAKEESKKRNNDKKNKNHYKKKQEKGLKQRYIRTGEPSDICLSCDHHSPNNEYKRKTRLSSSIE